MLIVCMQDTFARATHPAGRPSAARDDRVSCIQVYSSKTKCMPYERALCAQERAHMQAACLLKTCVLSSIIQVYDSKNL